jgi:uncharacterized protein (TIGR02186 family)
MRRILLWALGAAVLLAARPAQAAMMIAELSDHTISIRTDFQGEDILLFGTTGTPLLPSDNLVVTIKGPQHAVIVREKVRSGPIWHNAGFARFEDIYSFFQLYTAKPLDPGLAASVLGVHELSLAELPLPVSVADLGPGQTLDRFRAALRIRKATDGLYAETTNAMTVVDSLFWTTLKIPRNVPTGRYIVDVFLIREGQVTGAIRLPLDVFKDGIGAEIFLFAHKQPLLYGIFGVVLAAGTGLLVSWAFRKL